MKGSKLFKELCTEAITSTDQSKRDYAVELMAAFEYMDEDLYPLLEKAEAEGKKIVVKYGEGMDHITEVVAE